MKAIVTVVGKDRIGIIGANGAGKTTLLKILSGESGRACSQFSEKHRKFRNWKKMCLSPLRKTGMMQVYRNALLGKKEMTARAPRPAGLRKI